MNPRIWSKAWTRVSATVRNRSRKFDQALFGGERKWWFIRPFMLNSASYRLAKALRLREAEHQIGRLKNMDAVMREIKDSGVPGNIVEFGTYQGFSLRWLAYFRDKYKLTHMKVIGIDSFEGLPETSTVWTKGQFNDTSFAAVERTLCRELGCAALADANVLLIQGWYNDPRVGEQLEAVGGGVALAHLDCDLGSSCRSALDMVVPVAGNQPWYLLLDDWGNDHREIPACVDQFFEDQPSKRLVPQGATLLTRYFKVQSVGSSDGRESRA